MNLATPPYHFASIESMSASSLMSISSMFFLNRRRNVFAPAFSSGPRRNGACCTTLAGDGWPDPALVFMETGF